MTVQLPATSFALRLPFTALGLVVPDPSVTLDRRQIAEVGCALIFEREGRHDEAKLIIGSLESSMGVTEHDRFVADHGRDAIAGPHCSLLRPRRGKPAPRKPAQDPAVFTREDLKQIAKAELKVKSPDQEIRQQGHKALQVIVDRREARIFGVRSGEAVAEATTLSDLRDGSVQKLRGGRLRRVDGLELLRASKAIGPYGFACAQRYGRLYAGSQPRPAFRSCLAAIEGSDGGIIDLRSPEEQVQAERQAKARAEHRRQQRQAIDQVVVRASSARALLLLQQVAGEGASIASLSSSGPMRTVFRREVIEAVAALEVIFSEGRLDLIDKPEMAPIDG